MDAARTGRKFTLIFSEEKRTRALGRLPVGDVWGVGRKLEPKFRRLGIRTALDLSRVEPRYMRKNFTIIQEKTVRELRGERVFSAVETPEPQKSLLTSRSFGETVEELSELEEAVSTFAVRTAAKLRARRLVASGLCVFLATNRFREDLPQYCDELAVGFARATNSTPEILKTALALIRRLYLPGYAYKKAGVLALDTLDESTAAKRRFLFEPNPGRPEEIQERDRTLCRAVDAANLRFGRNAVFFASEGIAPRWRPRSEMVSPCYLTDWNDIPVVYAK
ncbi:MAG: DUF4113 domain-containing protein [Thermoguttaceae bacterium]|nr:DUF4113 domain-containing protein [Thermoguttaceae bacterium]